MGALVLLTGTFAFMSAGYTFFIISKSPQVGAVIGVLWALTILNLDRLLLTTFPKALGRGRQAAHAAIRILLAAFIGITLGHPLTVRMFQDEIADKIAEEANEAETTLVKVRTAASTQARADTMAQKVALPETGEVRQRQSERDDTVNQLQLCEAQLTSDKQQYLCEADGTCGTGIKKCGPVCQEKKAAYAATERRCQQIRNTVSTAIGALTEAERRLAAASLRVEATLSEREIAIQTDYLAATARLRNRTIKEPSFFAQAEAMGRLGGDAQWKVRFVILSLVLIEIMVVVIKVITPADSADKLVIAIHEEFVKQRLPLLARTFANTGSPTPTPPVTAPAQYSTTSNSMSVGASPEELRPAWPRKLSYIVGTMLIMTVMLWLGSSLDEALTAAGLFVAVVTLTAMQMHRGVTT